MKAFNKGILLLTVLTAGTVLGIAGSTAGTLAWYAYSKNVTTSFVGTSIKKSVLLHTGLVDDQQKISDEDIAAYKMKKENVDGHYVLWTSSQNSIPTEVISKYLSAYGYGSNKLSPVTTKARTLSSTSDLELFAAPNYGEINFTEEADTGCYVHLPFAFKIIGSNGSNVADQDIWLTDATVKASGQSIDKSVRIFVENDTTKFLINPSDKSNNDIGYTTVCGMLDIDNDGTYDYDESTMEEYIYGDFDGTFDYRDVKYTQDEYDHSSLVNVNEVSDITRRTTFLAKHHVDTYIAQIDTISEIAPQKVEHYPVKKIYPSISNGKYVAGATGIPLANTNSTASCGYCTITVYIEGWDHSVINQAIGYEFNLGLTFEVNRLSD